jgi:hypothetical protein
VIRTAEAAAADIFAQAVNDIDQRANAMLIAMQLASRQMRGGSQARNA